MKKIYIHSSCSISIQPSFRDDYFFDEITEYSENGIEVIAPDYKEFIPPMQLRRMGKSMRMAVYAAQKAIQKAGNPKIDAVITGTGQGCLRDSEKFVEAMWDNDGAMLNPTPFIQSTHNMAAATVALALGCKGYNMTYTNNANSFESAVLDAILYLNENPEHQILIGGLDEISEKTMEFWSSAGYVNLENPKIPIDINSKSIGEVNAEGAGFFLASANKPENYLGVISAVETKFEVQNTEEFIQNFLEKNEISIGEIDAVILGYNGDSRYDGIYETISEGIFKENPQLMYKNVLGEFDTAMALAIETGLKVLKHQKIPEILQINHSERDAYKNILIYNQRRGNNHSLIFLGKE